MCSRSRSANDETSSRMRGHYSHAEAPRWLIKLGVVLTFTTFALGMLFWHFSGSVAVLSDALHSLFHCALWYIALRANVHTTLRKKARGELIMGVIIIIIGIYIGVMGATNIVFPTKAVSWQMIIIASIALASEVIQGKLMYSVQYKGVRVRRIHLIKILLRDVWADALASFGVLMGGVVILTTQFYRADGIVAIPIAFVAIFLGVVTVRESWDELKANTHHANSNDRALQ